MDTKKCMKCGVEKGLECFSRDATRNDGLQPYCKKCVSDYKAQYTANPINKARKAKYDADLNTNPEHKDKRKKYMADYYANPENKERLKDKQKEYISRPEVRDRKKERQREYSSKPEVKVRRNELRKKRKDSSPWNKLCDNMRKRMSKFIRGHSRSVSAVRHLGVGWAEFKPYFEAKFYCHPVTGEVMSWENYGKLWHVDHIYPLAKVDPENIDQVKAAFHYTNLQPLWAEENLKKHAKITGPRTPPQETP